MALAAGFWLAGCEQPVERRRPPPPPSLLPAPKPESLECSFDPVSRPGERAESGFELCYTPAVPVVTRPHDGPGLPRPVPLETEMYGIVTVEPCPPEMVLVEGEYCPDARQECLHWLDAEMGGTFLSRTRCAEFARNPRCVGTREHRRFCIDRYEHSNEPGGLPLVHQSWTMAKEACESQAKRLCFESEWTLACEGDELRPYPYGFSRDAKKCNHDQTDLSRRGKLRDLRVRGDERPDCIGPYGAVNLVGNADEWVSRDGYVRPWRSALHGGWWLAGRNNCRAATTAHDELYEGPQTGFRCCAQAL